MTDAPAVEVLAPRRPTPRLVEEKPVLVAAAREVARHLTPAPPPVPEFPPPDLSRARQLFAPVLESTGQTALLVDADLFALPSYHENFGIAVVEALASGTPVVVSDQVCLHREITRAGVGGVVSTDATALAGELQRWLADDALRQGARDRARSFALERYDWAKIAGRWQNHYAQICGTAAASRSSR